MAAGENVSVWMHRIEKAGAPDDGFYRAVIKVSDGSTQIDWPITLPFQVSGYGEAQEEAWRLFHEITTQLAQMTQKHSSQAQQPSKASP